jgi:glycosyltransferase involved in cell wall biosynthesis
MPSLRDQFVSQSPEIAVLIPAYNEAAAITQVIEGFRAVLPDARIYVFDNNSSDDTAALAAAAGAEVVSVPLQGKGNVVRRMFADIEADLYLMADGDTTYDHTRAQDLLEPIIRGEADIVIGTRKAEIDNAFPSGHRFGNKLFNLIVGRMFGRGLEDIFSGYRAFSRRFVKSFPAHSEGFEIETEMSIFILEQRIPVREIPTHYGSRPAGSHSKLHTYRDGLRILFTILRLFKESRPMAFFSALAFVFAVLSLVLGIPIVQEWLETGTVERIPSVMLASGLGILAVVILMAGMMLDSVARTYRETRHLRYLSVPPRQR